MSELAPVVGIAPLAAVMRRYAFAYTAAHNPDVCAELMTEDYSLVMGPFRASGRDREYLPAVLRQFRQFPGLGFTVHDLVLGEERVALHFSEHGVSRPHGRAASWSGISLYRWDGVRLTECRVEQDYFGRRAQLRGDARPVLVPPAVDPWQVAPGRAVAGVEAVARGWLEGGGLMAGEPRGGFDDEYARESRRVVLDRSRTTVLDLFSAEDRVAFHARVDGEVVEDPAGRRGTVGQQSCLYVAGLLRVADREVTDVRAVTDRLAFERRTRSDGRG